MNLCAMMLSSPRYKMKQKTNFQIQPRTYRPCVASSHLGRVSRRQSFYGLPVSLGVSICWARIAKMFTLFFVGINRVSIVNINSLFSCPRDFASSQPNTPLSVTYHGCFFFTPEHRSYMSAVM